MKVKYVVFNEMDVVMLGGTRNHSDVQGMGKPTSAGFCSFSRNPTTCRWEASVFGESTSLKLKPGPNDQFLLEFVLNF